LNYLSVCSGIEAATVAWHSLGWNPIGFSEIEPSPCKVLAHHYPNVPNFGDMTKFKEWPDANINVLVGGTPCQSFSVAGLRKGLDDPRGNLMLTYLAIADRYKPKWIVWENVPGVLSINGGRDFGTFLGGLGQLGYGFAYRVLDAQFSRTHEHPRAVPQRRRRVFVVGCLGDWRSAAAILFDSESLRGNPPPSRRKGQEIAGTISKCSPLFVPDYIGGIDYENNGHGMDVTWPLLKGSPTGGGRPLPAIVYALAGNTIGRAPENGGNGTGYDDTGSSYTLTKTDVHAVAHGEQHMRVRRLTPLECERLQGFPDNYTNVAGLSNSARYKALGNSMAVNCMRILGERIAMVESIERL
jgi:DNA (cytosine-5)-methyltransferase 1